MFSLTCLASNRSLRRPAAELRPGCGATPLDWPPLPPTLTHGVPFCLFVSRTLHLSALVSAFFSQVTVLDITTESKEVLDTTWFPANGAPRTIEGVRSAGHIVMSDKLGEMNWRYLVGEEVKVLDVIGRKLKRPSASGQRPTWLFHNASPLAPRPAGEGRACRCHPCSLWTQTTVLKPAGHQCLFLPRLRGPSLDLPACLAPLVLPPVLH